MRRIEESVVRSSLRSPDAAQRVALCEAVRCRAGVPVAYDSKKPGVAALRSGMKNAAPRPGHVRYLPTHFGGRFSENAFGPSM
jgi:hypothetical protein